MIKLICNTEVVVYAGVNAYPELLALGSDEHLVVPPEVLFPLRHVNGRKFTIELSEESTVKNLIMAIKQKIRIIMPNFNCWDYIEWAFVKGERYYFDDDNQNLLFIISKYFGYPDDTIIGVQFLISANAGEVDNAEGLEYYVHSRERCKHNLPHVHVNSTDHNHWAVIKIEDGEIIEGKLPGRLKKKAKERILDNQQFFFECWNKMTDGIRVDINRHFHLIGY